MIKAATSFCFAIGTAVILLGCREYRLFHYEEVNESISGGELNIKLVPYRQISNEGTKKIAVEGNPYTLLFELSMPDDFDKFEIRDLRLRGSETGNVISLLSSTSGMVRKHDTTGKYFAIATFSSQLIRVSLKHEPFEVKAMLTVHDKNGDKNFSEMHYTLIPKYTSEKRSDILDAIMGI